jgi:hypothetical protein
MLAIAHPDTTRFDHDHVINPSAAKSLDSRRRTIWYTVDIGTPIAAESEQVILEQGMGYAIKYNPYRLPLFVGLLTSMSGEVFNPVTDIMDFVERLYSELRYFFDDRNQTNPRPQNPSGDYDAEGMQPKMEDV